jgi:predicted ATPase
MALMAEALVAAGRADAALPLLDEALDLSETTGERYYAAETHRLKGERLLAHGGESAIEAAGACFAQALTVARQQAALSFELRTAVSLARLPRGRPPSTIARTIVRPVYERFHEGFDTVDLREARSALD